MTVDQLIAELQRLPRHLPVRLLMVTVDLFDELGDGISEMDELDALEADEVKHCGAYALVSSR